MQDNNDINTAVMDFKSELGDAVSQAIDVKVQESGGIDACLVDYQILALEQR